MYGISTYGKMVADPTRIEAYSQALRQAITPNSTVLDLGSGTGVFALLACKFGARRVYAIEPNRAILVAKANAAANGFADRIVFFQELSTRVSLPEKVDVLVSDLRGILPLFEKHLPAIVDARKRFLSPGAVQIPLSDRILVAPVEAPEEFKENVLGHDSSSLGVDVEAAVRHTSNSLFKVNLLPGQLLAEEKRWAALDYTAALPSDYAAGLSWTVRPGVCHGLAVWFDTVLSKGISYSNAPGQPCKVYRQIFFPWPKPVEPDSGDLVTVELKANLVGDDYVWRWDSRVICPERSADARAQFQQSSFYGIPLDPSQLRKRSAQYVPTLDEDGQIDRFVLNAMAGEATVEMIAADVVARFPKRFPSLQDSLNWVAALSAKYSR
jgi:protein arginine N-methyltransferase 1